MGSFDPKAFDTHAGVPAHDHPFSIPELADLVQLAVALGGGTFPGMGNGQNDTMPNQDSVAPGFPLNLFFVVPANQVKSQAVKLTFQPGAFRTYVTGSTGAGTNHSHGGDTVANEAAHNHGGDPVGSDTTTNNVNHNHGHSHSTNNHQHTTGVPGLTGSTDALYYDATTGSHLGKALTGTASLITDVSGTSGMTSDSTVGSAGHNHGHAHTPGTTGAGSTHGHTPGTTGGEATHTHSPTQGVVEGTSPDAMRVLVDGTDVTTTLGGPFSTAQTNLDITKLVAPGTGIHTVQVTTTTNLGRISGWVRNSSIVNALSP